MKHPFVPSPLSSSFSNESHQGNYLISSGREQAQFFHQIHSSAILEPSHDHSKLPFAPRKINYLDHHLFIRDLQHTFQQQEKHHTSSHHYHLENHHHTRSFTSLISKEFVHVSGFDLNHADHVHVIHRFHKSGLSSLFYATYQNVFMIIEAGRVVCSVEMNYSSSDGVNHHHHDGMTTCQDHEHYPNTNEPTTNSNDMNHSTTAPPTTTKSDMADSINHVQVKEAITESNIHFFYFVICTDHCVKIMKWEKIHKDSMKSLMCIERHGKRALQSSTIQDLLCVIWEDGLVVYKISYSKGKFEPISNLLLCGGRIRQLLAIEAEGWIVVQETSNRVLELPLREESSSIKSVTKATTTGITLVQKNSIEETSYCVESNTTLQENEVVTLSKKSIRNSKPILLNNSLILPELDLSNRILNDQEEEHHEKFPSKIMFIKAEQNQIKIANEETGILTKFPDMIYGVHDRLQNSIFHIVTANRTEPQLEYIEYNYKSPNDSTTQLIRLEKHQRLLGLDISHQQPSLDNVLIIQALSGEREKQVGGIFFCNIKKNALENFENISLTKFMRKIHIQEDPNISTPVTPYLNNSPRGDPFGSASPILVHQQNTLINTILRELREMKSSVDNKLDIILTEMHSLENRVKRIENHLQMEKK